MLNVVQRTWNFQIDRNAPISCSLRAVDIQVPQSNFLHTFLDFPRLLLSRDSYFLPLAFDWVESVNKMQMVVLQRRRGVIRLV